MCPPAVQVALTPTDGEPTEPLLVGHGVQVDQQVDDLAVGDSHEARKHNKA